MSDNILTKSTDLGIGNVTVGNLVEMMRGTPPPTWEQTCLKLSEEKRELQEQIKRMESFINRFLDPEDLGYAVNNYVRDDAREALGRERVESKP